MSGLQIGRYIEGGASARLNLESFLETRGLLQANSGGGKSYTLRRIIEVMADRVQQIIIDTEGEFASLRERFDFVIVAAAGGDAIAHPRTAALLSRRLLETRVSAILDISELKAHQRDEFVRNFIDGLMALPRDLWGELLVILDEAHAYCPEKGQGEALATAAVIDLASRGRKRGFCLLAATQRSSKFHKSAAAELLNKFVGRTGLDVDVKRAAFDLGMTPKDAQATLSNLDAGQFYVFGPAISKTVALMKCDEVQTTHPKTGSRGGKRALQLPKPTYAIRAVLPQLADLQEEQERKAKTEEDLRRELATAQRELTARRDVQVGHSDAALAAATDKANAAGYRDGFQMGVDGAATKGMEALHLYATKVEAWLDKFPRVDDQKHPEMPRFTPPPRPTTVQVNVMPEQRTADQLRAAVLRTTVRVSGMGPEFSHGKNPVNTRQESGRDGLQPVQARILDAVAELEQIGARAPPREMVAFMANYTNTRSKGFTNAIGALNSAGLTEVGDGTVRLTVAGRQMASPPAVPRSAQELQARLIAMLGGASGRILQPLIDAYPGAIERESLAAASGYGNTRSKGFTNAMGRLSTLGFLHYPERGHVAARPVLFLEGI